MALGRLTTFNLKVKPEKYHLFKTEIKYLGHVVSESGVSPGTEKVQAVVDWQIPTTEKEL